MDSHGTQESQRARQIIPWGQVGFVALLLVIGGSFIFHALSGGPGPANLPPTHDVREEALKYLEQMKVEPLSGGLAEVLAADTPPVPTQPHPLLGKVAPDFTLRDPSGKTWRLADRLADGPVILVFYYGYYCDHCVGQLFAIHKDIGLFRELGATVLAVSPDEPGMTRDRFEQYGPFAFPALADPGNTTARAYDVYKFEPMWNDNVLYHATFVIDRGGVVRWAQWGDQPFIDNRTLLCEVAKVEGQLPGKADMVE